MRRISFDDSEEQRMSNALQLAFGKVTSTVVPKDDVTPLLPTTDLSGDSEPSGDTEEYEKRVIMESVRRAKERSGLTEEGVSAVSARGETGGALNYAPDVLIEPEFVYLPFGVFRERIGIAEKIIFFYLCSIAKQGAATASLRRIVEGTSIGKTCVCQALSELRGAGWIRWDMVRSGRSRLNRYFILRWGNTGGSDCGQCSGSEQSSEYGLCSQNGHSSEYGQCSDSEQSVKSLAVTGFVGDGSENGQCSESGHGSDYGHGSENGQCSQNGHSSEYEQRSDSEQSGKCLAVTGFVGCGSENGQCSGSGQSSEYGNSSESGQCPQNGHGSDCGQCSDSEQSGKSLAVTGFIECSSECGQCLDGEQCSDSGQCSDFEQRREIVDTTEFRRDLVEILRTVKTVDLKDLKDIKILKDLKDNKNKISDYVNNLCITHVDNSMVAEYVSTMFRIAFPEQSTERLQIVRKLTERLQVGFAWYVVLLYIIKSSPYLMGKEKNSEGWKCTLTWALAAENYPKIMQLTYVKYGLRWTPQNFIEYLCRALEKGEY